MRVIALCAVVIAGSTFATAVESIYGWSNVKPVVQKTWDTGYRWGKAMLPRLRRSASKPALSPARPPRVPAWNRSAGAE